MKNVWKFLLGFFIVSFLFSCEGSLKGSPQELRALAEKKISLAKKVSDENELKDKDFIDGNENYKNGLSELTKDKAEGAIKSFSSSVKLVDKFLDRKKQGLMKDFFGGLDSFLKDLKGTFVEFWPKGVYEKIGEMKGKWKGIFENEDGTVKAKVSISDDDLIGLSEDYDMFKRYGYLRNYKDILASHPEIDAEATEMLKKLSQAEEMDIPNILPQPYSDLLSNIDALNEDLKQKDAESFAKHVSEIIEKLDKLIEMAKNLQKISEFNLKAVEDLRAELTSLWEELSNNGKLPPEEVEGANSKTMAKMMDCIERSSKGLGSLDAYKNPPEDKQ